MVPSTTIFHQAQYENSSLKYVPIVYSIRHSRYEKNQLESSCIVVLLTQYDNNQIQK